MDIRPYSPADREGCLAALQTVAPESREAFAKYLDTEPILFVADHDGSVVGFGGIALNDASARLEWGTVRKDVQGMGLDRFLLMFRLKEISRRGNYEFVAASEQESSREFLLAEGFRENGGILVKRLSVCQ